MKIHEALANVMADVQSVSKSERNTHQNFSFRGIDAVLNAVGPAFRKHGVIVLPEVTDYTYSQLEIGTKRTLSGHAMLTVRFTFVGPEGDTLSATVVAESMDSGDKATAKAMSVALRTALLQSLCLPTDEPDPDHSTYERSGRSRQESPVEVTDPISEAIVRAESVEQLDHLVAAIKESEDPSKYRDLWARRHRELT